MDRSPQPGTVEHWCVQLVTTTQIAHKLSPPPPPDVRRSASWEREPPVHRLAGPGRPPELTLTARSPRTPRAAALASPDARARLVHTFMHHELQAAELFAWALLAFPETPRAFRAGLLRLCLEELEHLALYSAHLATLGASYGDFGVRDWFWERVATCADPLAFVALLGVGLEGANLEHTARFAAAFRVAGDEAGALLLERVQREEVGHVAFALQWFRRFAGGFDYERWAAALPAPLTPALLRGLPLERDARLRAGLDEDFLARLAAEPSTTLERP